MTEPLRPDIEAARNRMSSRLGSNREIRKLVEHLWHGETVTHMASGAYAGGTGLLVLTDRKALFVKDGWTSQTMEHFPFEKIDSVQWSGGMVHGKILIFSGGSKSEITQVPKTDGKDLADTLNNAVHRRAHPAPPPPPMSHPVPMAQPQPAAHAAQGYQPTAAAPGQPDVGQIPTFELVKTLRNRGVINDQEFAHLVARL